MANPRRDGIYSREARRGSVARGQSTAQHSGSRSHLNPTDPVVPYIHDASDPASRPGIPSGERPDQPEPEMAHIARLNMRRRHLQRAARPLTCAELMPGLWVEIFYTNKNGVVVHTRKGLLAINQREPERLVLWNTESGRPDSKLVLGPSDIRDDSMRYSSGVLFMPEYEAELRHKLRQDSRAAAEHEKPHNTPTDTEMNGDVQNAA
ncbi:hypothetical protein JK364_23705 [Streptomyces sp. 110]|uniref:Uncharacterized protein n=1 Tax=Streptomyces endocoffeicus TaxID=2898945 RepID=A0ABS1PTE4_9ACTN|nr:hypothetical protein [Streptomyces endocoffeicus]MBL1115380.1 hypothetical protein [Streptomyces endocoffeicus]